MISKFIPVILASGLVSFLVTPLMVRLARRINFVDAPASRKLHVTPMPMLGGVAIYAGMATAVLFSGTPTLAELVGVLGGATIVTAFGVWDDRFGMPPAVKLIGQIIAAALLIFVGIQVRLFHNDLLDIALTVLWVVGISNAVNFLDNMDGLAAGLAGVASAFFFIIAVVEGLGLVASVAAATLGACVAFLYYNFSPATLFMGDAGSMLLGFVLAVLGIKLEFSSIPTTVTWMIPILVLGLPIFDTTLVVISRLRGKRPVYLGGKDHVSHRLMQVLKMSPARAVVTLYLIAAGLGLLAIVVLQSTPLQAGILALSLAILFIAALIWFEVRFKLVPPTNIEPPTPH